MKDKSLYLKRLEIAVDILNKCFLYIIDKKAGDEYLYRIFLREINCRTADFLLTTEPIYGIDDFIDIIKLACEEVVMNQLKCLKRKDNTFDYDNEDIKNYLGACYDRFCEIVSHLKNDVYRIGFIINVEPLGCADSCPPTNIKEWCYGKAS